MESVRTLAFGRAPFAWQLSVVGRASNLHPESVLLMGAASAVSSAGLFIFSPSDGLAGC